MRIFTTIATLPPRVLVHGLEGVGKTTLASKFPNPVFVQIEDGTGSLELQTFGVLSSYSAVLEAISVLGHEPHEHQTVVVDAIDKLEGLLWAHLCERNGWKSIEDAGYGKGYVLADALWAEFLRALDWLRRSRGMIVVLVAHSAIETINDPRAPSYTSYQLRLHRRARGLVQDEVDVIGFLATDLIIQTENQGFNRKRTRAEGSLQRWLHVEGRPSFVAKNRYGMPDRLMIGLDFDFEKSLAPFFPKAVAGPSATLETNQP